MKRLPKARQKKGVALLLTLGVLTLMMALALSFTAAALNSQKTAMLSTHLAKTREYAETSLQRVISMLKSELQDYTEYGNFFPGTRIFVEGSGDWQDFYYVLSVASGSDQMDDGLSDALSYSVNGLDYFPPSLPTANASWLPIFENRSVGGSVIPVMVGRYAFLLVDETGKIDPNTAVDTSYTEGSEPLQGFQLSELDLRDAGFSSTFANKLRPAGAGTGMQPAGAKWFSRYHIMRVLNGTQDQLDQINKVLFPYRRPDLLEAVTDLFDLATVESATVNDVVTNIPWLDNWNNAGNLSGPIARAKNIAANLIDYSDTDHDATRDSDTSPTYLGVEKVPMISRLQFKVVNKCRNRNSNHKTQPRVQLKCRVELVNLFGDLSAYTNSCWVQVVARVTFKDENNQTKTSSDLTYTFTLTPPTHVTGNFNGSGYIRGTSFLNKTVAGRKFNGANRFRLTNVKVNLRNVTVRKTAGGDFWDRGVYDGYTSAFTLNNVNNYKYTHFKPRTPFIHFRPGEWSFDVTSTNKWAAPYVGNPGTDTPSTWTDHPLYIRNNTMQHLVELAYILRMEPYDASDEAKAFRTLNMLDYKYNGDPEVPGDYSDAEDGTVDNYDGTLDAAEGNGGDRNILDSVRLGDQNAAEKILIGRININTRHRDVLNALYYRVDNEAYGSGAPIPRAGVDTLITNIMNKTANRPLPVGLFQNNRNQMLYGLLFDESSLPEANRSGLTHLQKTYLLMLTRELVTARHNYFSVIIAAQSIQDVGAPPPNQQTIRGISSQLGRYDEGADRILAEQKIKAVLYRDAFTNKINVERFEFIDE